VVAFEVITDKFSADVIERQIQWINLRNAKSNRLGMRLSIEQHCD
jgi:hypothetical protein